MAFPDIVYNSNGADVGRAFQKYQKTSTGIINALHIKATKANINNFLYVLAWKVNVSISTTYSNSLSLFYFDV